MASAASQNDTSPSTEQPAEQPCTSSVKKPATIEPTGSQQPRAAISNKSVQLDTAKQLTDPIDEQSMKECVECHEEFRISYLYRNFRVNICDDCRRPRDVHELITRTDAKSKYLLKDCDLDLREPPLRYMLKKNPYQSRGDMKLYLKFQIEERALLVHGSEEQLEQELERREDNRMVKKQRFYEKKMKTLSKEVRSSLFKHKLTENHQHEWGEPVCIDEDNDLYRRECATCGHKWDYEEM